MKQLYFLFWGIVFGIVLIKSEVASWFRIYEMFQFDSFHMYGVIGSAVIFGIILTQVIKRMKIKSIDNTGPWYLSIKISCQSAIPFWRDYIFGLGWALTGACPGPMFALVGRRVLLPLSFAIIFSPY